MAHDFFNEQKELQRNSKYAILLDASLSNYTNEQREVFNNLKDELIDKLGFNPLINYSPFGSGVLNNRGNVILMFDDDSNLLGLLEFTIEPKYTIVPRYSPDYIKPEPIFENNENVFYLEYIFSFSRGNGQKMMNRIKKYADQYNVDIGLEGSIIVGTEGKPIASAKHLQRFYDKQGFINVRGHYFLYNPNSNEGGLTIKNEYYTMGFERTPKLIKIERRAWLAHNRDGRRLESKVMDEIRDRWEDEVSRISSGRERYRMYIADSNGEVYTYNFGDVLA
jgi:hypothetical protein